MFKVAPVQSLWLQYPHIALFHLQQSGVLGFVAVCKLFIIQCRLLLRSGFSCQPSQGIPVPCEPVVFHCCAWQDSRLRRLLLPTWNSRLNSQWTSSRGWQTWHWWCALPRYMRGSCIPVAAFADPSSGKAQQGLHILWYFLWLYAELLFSEQLPNMLLAWWGLTGTSPPGPTNCAHLPCCGFQHHFRHSRMWKRWSETNAKWAWSGCSPKCQLPN